MKCIYFSIPPQKDITYQVDIQTYLKDCKKDNSSLSYDINFRLKKETFSGSVIEINRKNMILDDTKIHNVMNELLLLTSNILNNLELKIDRSGKIHKIRNMKQIHQKWKEIRMQIDSGYTGDVVSKLVNPMEKIIMNEELFSQALLKDPFFRFYFGIYGEYNQNKMIQQQHVSDFRIMNKSTYQVIETNYLQQTESGNYIVLKKINTDKSILEEYENLNVKLHCKYSLSNEEYLMSMKSTQEVHYNDELIKSTQMKVIQK